MRHPEFTDIIFKWVNRDFEYLSQQNRPAENDIVIPLKAGLEYRNKDIDKDILYRKILSLFKHYLSKRFHIKTIDVIASVEKQSQKENFWMFKFVFIHRDKLRPNEAVYRADDSSVTVEYSSQKGFILGIRMIIDALEFNRGRFLPEKTIKKSVYPEFRITSTVFSTHFDDPDFKLSYPDSYLRKLCLAGIDGVHMYINLFDYSESSILPELNSPRAGRLIKSMKKLSGRLSGYGIKTFLHLNTPKMPGEHRVFRKHPDLRGASQFDRNSFCLCSSRETTIKYYGEVINNIINKIDVGGLIFLIGGESFMHCYTRPLPRTARGTNCPVCARKDADTVVANFVNSIVRLLNKERRGKILVWPYSAFVWSGDTAQEGFIRKLSPETGFLSNFDSNHWLERDGVKTFVYDYSISNIGPSETFKRQDNLLRKLNRPHYAKFESAVCIETFNVPYLPLMHRWADKAEALRNMKVKGDFCNWRLYGWTDSIPEQIFEAYSEDPVPDKGELLKKIAVREFGKGYGEALKAWKYFSDSFDYYPYSGAFIGGRVYYFKGPMYLGPAHPFVFDVESRYKLSRNFFDVDPCMTEIETEEFLNDPANMRPKYFSDLYWTHPFGVEKLLTLLNKIIKLWEKGEIEWRRLMKRRLNKYDRRNAVDHYGVALAVGSSFRTAYNLGRFYMLRDKFFYEAENERVFRETIETLKKIIAAEERNVREVIPFLKRDRRIGYGFTYGPAYTAGMVEEKIRQLKAVTQELDSFAEKHRFHLYSK